MKQIRKTLYHGTELQYTLRRLRNARHIRIRISCDRGVEVVGPQALSIRAAEQMLHSQWSWVQDKITEITQQTMSLEERLKHGSTIPFLGSELAIQYVSGSQPDIVLNNREQCLEIALPSDVRADPIRVKYVLEQWMRYQARCIIQERASHFANIYGLTYNSIRIKDQRTRWGSCSSKQNLNFNWRLVLAPLEILDYVVIHELCHLKQPNHSTAFWELVALQCPDYRTKRRWLHSHTNFLRI